MTKSSTPSSSNSLLSSPLATLISAGPEVTPDPAVSLMGSMGPSQTASLGRSKFAGMESHLADLLKEERTLEDRVATENLNRENLGRKQSSAKAEREKAKYASSRLATEASIDRHQVRLREVAKEIKKFQNQLAAHDMGARSVEDDFAVEKKSARTPNFGSFPMLKEMMKKLALSLHSIGGAFRGMFGTLDEDDQKRLLEERTRLRERQDNWSIIANKGGPSPTPDLELSLNRDEGADSANPFNQVNNPLNPSRNSRQTGGLAPRR